LIFIFIFTFSSFIIIAIITMEGRFYVVTGAASGIGQAVTIRLTELGAAGITISDVNFAGLEDTKEKCTYYILFLS
jgi:NAD(P)-dependent dehydrogenase (short-subunit alcohol dehydrogenase family)